MDHIKYSGQLQFKGDQAKSNVSILKMNEQSFYSSRDKFYVSKSQLVKFESTDYLLLIDGIIYEFDHKPFSEDKYSLLIDNLSKDMNTTLQKINGEFVLFFVERNSSTIVIATSESGNLAFFYQKLEGTLLFSNSLNEMLISKVGIPDVHFQRVFDVLTGNNLGSEFTCFSNVLRLLPGQYMAIAKGEIKILEYSDLFTPLATVKPLDDPYLIFQRVFQHAVEMRLVFDRIGSALSSGLDSTAVTAMALLRLNRERQKIIGYTYKPVFLPDGLQPAIRYDETILLASFRNQYPELEHREVRIEDGSILGSLEKAIDIFGEPVYGASNQFWIQEMHRLMHEDGCGVMLTGQGGNYTISWPPPELVSGESRNENAIMHFLHKIRHPRSSLPYVSRDFLETINRDHFINKRLLKDLHNLQPILLRNSISYTGYLQKQVSLYHGLHVTDPTVDKHVIESCETIIPSVF